MGDRWAKVDAIAASETENHGLVGLAVGVAYQGKVVFAKGYGFEDREAKIPIDPEETLFRWASVSKTATGVVAASLAHDGVIAFDDPIAKHYRGYAPKAFLERCTEKTRTNARGTFPCKDGFADVPLEPDDRGITIRRLGGHLAGVAHYDNGRGTPNPSDDFLRDASKNTGMQSALVFLADKPLVMIPGERLSYTSFGFNLLGVVLESASKTPFGDLVNARINDKIGTHISLDREAAPLPRRAVGYQRKDGVITRQDRNIDVSWKAAGGGLLSTITDFARYCAALDGESLLAKTDKAELWTSQNDANGKATDYGFGFEVGTYAGERLISHDGAQEKVRTSLTLYPERHFCTVVMSNAEYAEVGGIAGAIDRAMLEATR